MSVPTSIDQSRDYVLEQVRINIERVKTDPGYVRQAQQVNSSLTSLVAMERSAVMMEVVKLSKAARIIEQNGNAIDM